MNKQEIIERLSADEDRCKYCNSSTVSGGDIYCSASHSRDMDCDGKDFKLDYKINEVLPTQGLTNGWIPVSEPPTEYGTYMVAWRPINMTETDVKAKTRSQTTHFYEILEYDPEDESGWLETIEQSEGAYEILAWQPLPEPYKEVSE